MISVKSSQRIISITIYALFVSGCSSSSDSTSIKPATNDSTLVNQNDSVSVTVASDAMSAETNVDGNTSIDSPTAEEQNEEQDSTTESPEEALEVGIDNILPDDISTVPVAVNSGEETIDTVESEGVNLIAEDPLIQITTEVNFDITVPAYQSNSLQVRLTWGDIDMTADWIGDEYWSVSATFPTDTEHLLSITFYDNNGSLELGSVERMFNTGTNAAESYQVTAEQFDTGRWDADSDGKSNLDELIAETDPLVDEDSLLEIHDFLSMSSFASVEDGAIGNLFETQIPDERPYFVTYEGSQLFWLEQLFGEVNIDADGNGSLTNTSNVRLNRESRSGNRTNTGTSILWEGKTTLYDGDYGSQATFSSDVSKVDENTYTYIEQTTGSHVGTFSDSWDIDINLTGKLIEGTSFCKPVSGTVLRTHKTNRYSFPIWPNGTTLISKDADDLFWRVIQKDENSVTTAEYFVRELHLFKQSDPQSANFKCDLIDL